MKYEMLDDHILADRQRVQCMRSMGTDTLRYCSSACAAFELQEVTMGEFTKYTIVLHCCKRSIPLALVENV